MTDPLESLKEALADRYSIERELGSGGMAVVYLARDLKLGREVALKVLRPELASSLGAERFVREIQIAAKLNHPNILGLHDCGEADGHLYYTMPYVAGESLRDRLNREGQLPLEDALQITQEVADALGHAHSMGLVHRDIKPENIMLDSGHAIVTDFGIARAVAEAGGEKLTQTGVAVGTPTYMSPEQGAGAPDVDARSDIYSLGCVLYEMLSGDAPYIASTPYALIAKKLSEPTPNIRVVREMVPAAVEVALTKALAKTPADRFSTAMQFSEALTRPSVETQLPDGASGATSEQGRKRPLWQWAALVAIAVVVAVGAMMLTGDGSAGAAAGDDAGDRFVVAPFENRTGDPAADDWAFTAAERITRAMDRAAVVTVVPASAVRDIVREAGTSGGLPLDDIARRTDARYAVAGSYSVSASRLRFDAELVNAGSGALLRSLPPIEGPSDSLDAVFGLLAERVTAATAAMLSPGIQAGWSSPPTLEAVTGLMATQDLFCRMRWQDAIDEAEATLEQAPDFPPLLYMTAGSYWGMNRFHEADSVLAQMEPLREQMTSAERLLEQWFHGLLHGDHAEATRAAEQLFRLQPGDYGYHAGFTALNTNRFDDALERFLATDLESSCYRVFTPWWQNTAETYHMLERYDDELAHARQGLERFPGWRPLIYFEAVAHAGLGQLDAVDSLLDVIAELPAQPVELGYTYSPGSQTAYIALELKALGYQEAYERVMERSLNWFAAQPAAELRFERGEALYYAERWSDVDTLFAALIDEWPENPDGWGYRGVALAHLGQRDEALAIDRRLAAVDQPFLLGRPAWWRAAIAAALGDRIAAVGFLQQAYREGMPLGYYHHRDPEWESLRDYRAYQELLAPGN